MDFYCHSSVENYSSLHGCMWEQDILKLSFSTLCIKVKIRQKKNYLFLKMRIVKLFDDVQISVR